jgi:hypothetical protein
MAGTVMERDVGGGGDLLEPGGGGGLRGVWGGGRMGSGAIGRGGITAAESEGQEDGDQQREEVEAADGPPTRRTIGVRSEPRVGYPTAFNDRRASDAGAYRREREVGLVRGKLGFPDSGHALEP